MNTTQSKDSATKAPKRLWRRHSDEFKARVIEQARQPHVSVASVALANGINANMLRCWLRDSVPTKLGHQVPPEGGSSATLEFVQLPMQSAPVVVAPTAAIEVQIHRGETRVEVSLPLGSSSAAWLREVLA